jgi:O-antigen/teichoic acid export membrane protein
MLTGIANIRLGALARNTVLSLMGQGAPLLVAMVPIPRVVRGLGTERYGIWSLAGVAIGYFGLFDLGLGRAASRFTAELLGRERVSEFRESCGRRWLFRLYLGVH